MDRRAFLKLATAGAASVAAGSPRLWGAQQTRRHALRLPPSASPDGLTLTARVGSADVGPASVEAWLLNGFLPSPTLRARPGDVARVTLRNELPEPTILHWHGLAVPESADGHPRFQVPPGGSYAYEFPIVDRPGTYWYHPHTHRLTSAQTYSGLGGFLIVEGDEAEAYALPSGERDLPLILQDKRLAGGLSLDYRLGMGPDMMFGLLGDTAFANGVANASVEVDRAPHRLRVLNGSSARMLLLALSNGDPFVLVGTDGGLLEAPVRIDRILLAPAERADVLVDFSASRPGERVVLRSEAFTVPGMMMPMGMMGGRGMGRGGRGRGGLPQGTAMDLLEMVVRDSPAEPPPSLPARFEDVPDRGRPDRDTPRRSFRFRSMMMSHTINGRSFELERVDLRVARNRTEVWTFVNDSELPHPVHVHSGQFRVLSRRGGRGRVLPWERGLKDTVLTLPGESVDVAVRFPYPGIFLLHCHNLEHEDMGMMLNFEVEE